MEPEERAETRLLEKSNDSMRQENASGHISSRKGLRRDGTADASPLLASERTLVDIPGEPKSSSFEEVDFGRGSVAEEGVSRRTLGFQFWKRDSVRLSGLVRSAALLLLGGALGFFLAHVSDRSGSILKSEPSSSSSSPPPETNVDKRFTLDDMFSPDSPAARRPSITWISWTFPSSTSEPSDGYYIVVNETSSDFLVGNVEAHGNRLWNGLGDEDWDSVPDGSMETVLRGKDLPKDGEGKPAWIASFVPSPAPKLGGRAQYLLLETSRTKVWRHSHKSSYWVCLLEQKDTEASKPRCRPLIDPADASNITLGPGEAASDFTMEIQHGEFSSSGKRIIFARGNDLYLTTTATLFSSNPMRTRITNDGTKHRILNGIADWVYEEEVFESTDAIWSHPDIDHLFAFLRTDDTDVYTIDIPIYDPTDRREADDESYPGHKKLRYPKAGSPNPSVSVWIYDGFGKGAGRIIGIEDAWKVAGGTVEDFLILDVSWYPSGDGLANSAKQPLLLVRSSNRNQTLGKELLVSFDADKHLWIARVARTLSEADGAWIYPGPNLPIDSRSHVVLTNRPDDGRQHIGYFSSPESKTIDRWLTWGSGWDVTSIVGVNSTAVIFEATLDPASYERADGKAVSGIERHVWAVDLGTANGIGSFPRLRLLSPRTSKPPAVKRGRNSILQAISGLKSHLGSRSTAEEAGRTESEQPAKFSARAVSPADQYLLLSYSGPALPWTAILPLAQPSGLILMESNERLGAHLRNYSLPTSRFFEIAVETSTGPQSLNTLEIRPPNFDSSGKTKYRALFRVYGGPSSQVVVPSFSLGFHEALASLRTDPYIIYQVDARGTFGRGRNFTTSIYRRLGQLEPQDQHAAARALCSTLPYLDAGRLAIWGWSFGGYLTSRVVDIDREPRTFKAAVAVAPVTDWSFYDSVYAERYLSAPAENPDGYHAGQVKGEGKGWSQGKTLVVHGTADDNVHFQNTAALISKLTRNLIPPTAWRTQVFADSDHGIASQDGRATQELYQLMSSFLDESLGAPQRGDLTAWCRDS